MTRALLALTTASALDIMRRGGTLVLAGVGVVLILSLRWFSAFGLGYEVNQLEELGVYTIGLLGAVAVVLFCLPREEESESAETLLLTRPVPVWVLSAGAFLGRLIPIALLMAVWTVAIFAALLWFELEDPQLFAYRGASSALAESGQLLLPVVGQLFATSVLLAFALPLASTRRPVLIGLGVFGLYVLGYAVAGFGGIWLHVLPDLTRHDLTPLLWGTELNISLIELLVHACAWCAAGVALDAINKTVRSVA